jgi:predicted lipoprotein
MSFTAVPIDRNRRTEAAFFFDTDDFDAKQYVADVWYEGLVPHMEENAVDIGELIAALSADPSAASEKHGHRAVQENNPYNYSVKGRIRIVSMNQGSSTRLEAAIAPFDGDTNITVQVGPVFRGTSIRDFLDFIKFEDFTNQVDFAKLANEFNFKVRDDVVKQFDFREKDYVGKEFDILGATTYLSGPIELVVTPIRMSIVGD